MKIQSSICYIHFSCADWLVWAMYILQERILCSSKIHNEWNVLKSASCSICILFFSSLVVLSSDDEDGPSEPKSTELLQDNITDNKETDQQSDFCFSGKQLDNKLESHTEQVVQVLVYVLLCQPFNLFHQCLFFLACWNKSEMLRADMISPSNKQ